MGRDPAKYERQKQTSNAWKKANPERHAELARAYRARNREKTAAQNRLNYALRQGLIQRRPCEVCGTPERVHAHHHDYNKPLEVRWLCFRCHKTTHPVSEEHKRVKFEGAAKARLAGERNPNAALTAKQVEVIRKLLNAGIAQQRIAQVFEVSQTTIYRIKHGKRYAT